MGQDDLPRGSSSNFQQFSKAKLTCIARSQQNKTHVTYDYVASRNSSVVFSQTLYKEHNFGAANCTDGQKILPKMQKKPPKVNARASIDF